MIDDVFLLRRKVEALERSQAVIEFSLDGRVLRANELFLKLMGYAASEVVDREHAMFVPPGAINAAEHEALWARLRCGEFTVGEFRRISKSGEIVWIQGVYCPLLDDEGRPCRILKFATDVTDRKRQDADFAGQIAAIRRSQAVAEFDIGGHLLYANEKFLDILGYPLEQIAGRHHSMFVEPEQRATPEYRAFWWGLRSGDYQAGLFKRIDSAGHTRWIQANYNPVRDMNGKITKIVKFASDQTAAVEDHVRVEYLYRHDTLTGLANRVGLYAAIEAALSCAADRPLTMLLVDLDRFKFINDSFGHPAGDYVLTKVAERIQRAAPDAIVVSRLGGDEFAIVLDDDSEAEAVAERIVASVSEPIAWNGSPLRVGASVGIAREGRGSELLRRADIALYAAKNAGRNTYRVFGESCHPEAAITYVASPAL